MTTMDEIARIERMSKAELRKAWHRQHERDPPPCLSAKLIRSGLMFDAQAARSGGISLRIRRKLARIASKLECDKTSPVLDTQALTPGTRLIREWRGTKHNVEVLSDGFAYGGAIYGSLSEIARVITGAHWSGPRFFGLKNRRKAL